MRAGFATALAAIASIGCGSPAQAPPGGPADARPQGDGPDQGAQDARPRGALGLSFVDPDHGPFRGGTEVTVRGDGFDETTSVYFGGRMVEPLELRFIDERRIVVRTPPGEPGLADVEVRKGDEVAAAAETFEYEAIAVDPPAGSVTGNTFVTVTGFGTDFDAATAVTFDNLPLVGVTVLNEQALTGFTPPGTAGAANVRVTTQTAVYEADRAYAYHSTGDPTFGGMSGGPIAGTLNVVVVDANTDDGLDGAYVVVGDPATSPLQGYADDLGQITFGDPELAGPVTVTAAALGYETGVMAGFDAQNITIALRTPPQPADGPLPPAPQTGRINGQFSFGDATTIGSPYWSLVPEPRTPTERKRVYVTTTARTMFSRPFNPTRAIDYVYDPAVTTWRFDVYARPSATAVVAIAGLYDPARDPSGMGTSGFEPFAMGVARGVLVGPGEVVTGVDITINIPFDSAVRVDLRDPPAVGTPGWPGPSYYTIEPFVDLGGEGVIAMNKNGMWTPPPPEAAPNRYEFPPGSETIVLGGMAPLAGAVADASYSFFVGAYTGADSNPYSVRVARGYRDISNPIEIGEFVATPRPLDPLPGGQASAQAMSFYGEAPPPRVPTFNLHMLSDVEGVQLLRAITRGDITAVEIPDVTWGGLPPFPGGADLSWTLWRIAVAGATFDQFTYRMLGALYWDAYTADAWTVQFPTP